MRPCIRSLELPELPESLREVAREICRAAVKRAIVKVVSDQQAKVAVDFCR